MMSILVCSADLKISSLSGIRAGARRPAADGRVCSVSWAVACPMVTGVVRCDPVVRGPDVAPMWPAGPELGRRPGIRLSRDAWPLAQLSPSLDRPLLSVGDRQGPMLRARRGHGRDATLSPQLWAGVAAGLVALAVHSGLDFLWHIPAIPVVGALLVSLITPITVAQRT